LRDLVLDFCIREVSRRAGRQAANLAVRQFVQERFALCPGRHGLQDFTPQFAQLGKPGPQVRRQLGVDFTPQALRQRWTLTCGRNSDLQITPLHDRGKEEVAQGRIIRGVAQDAVARGFFKDRSIDFAVIGGCDDEITTDYVRWFVLANQPVDLSRRAQLLDARYSLGRDHADRRCAPEQAFDLFQTDQARAYYQASLPFHL
jgi:hypothetical protein